MIPKTKQKLILKQSKELFVAIASLIESSKKRIVIHVNQELTLLNWQIGKHIHETLQNTDEYYGSEIVATLSPLLMDKFGKGYTISSLHRTHRFYKAFPNKNIVATLSPQLSWSHFVELTNIKEPLARLYYTELCKIEHWSIRNLRYKIESRLYERTALSKKPENLSNKNSKVLEKKKSLRRISYFETNIF